MAVYKVIQDVEAEDKLVGPLSLKAFIYAAVSFILLFLDARLLLSGLNTWIKIIFIFAFLPPMLLFGVLASPLGREQPTEIWLLSRIRFWLKPHERVWDQNGTKQLVTVTAPKRPMRTLTKNFSQTEVSSRLQSLAQTLDSRGWGAKSAAVNIAPAQETDEISPSDDRLSGAATVPSTAQVVDVHPADDIMDEQNNPEAQRMAEMVAEAEDNRRLQLADEINATQMAAKQQPPNALTPEEESLLDNLHQKQAEERQRSRTIYAGATDAPVTRGRQTVKLELAQSGNDLSVATIAKLANRRSNLTGEMNLPL